MSSCRKAGHDHLGDIPSYERQKQTLYSSTVLEASQIPYRVQAEVLRDICLSDCSVMAFKTGASCLVRMLGIRVCEPARVKYARTKLLTDVLPCCQSVCGPFISSPQRAFNSQLWRSLHVKNSWCASVCRWTA